MKKVKKRKVNIARVICILILIASMINMGVSIKLTIDTKNMMKNIESYIVCKKEIIEEDHDAVEDDPIVEEEVVEEEDELIYLGEFRLTGYCNCEICCGQWAGGPCANGEMPEEGWTIAVDPDIIPLNSYVWIDGFDHPFRADDTGSAIAGNKIDIYCNSHEECFNSIYNRVAKVNLIID